MNSNKDSFSAKVCNAVVFVFVLISLVTAFSSEAARVGDVVDVYGDRTNQLVGYGLVVGLDGTGDKSQVKFTQQSVVNMLKQFGVQLEGATDPKLKNVAAVTVTATMTPYSSPGQSVDATVSSIGDAKSLAGGTLLLTNLMGIDGKTYGIAQGNVVIGGFKASGNDGSSITKNIPTVGRIPNGVMIERAMDEEYDPSIVLNLRAPNYRTSINIAKKINEVFGDGVAVAMSKGSIHVDSPKERQSRVAFLSMLQDLEVEIGKPQPRVVFNSRTGTVVISEGVTVSRAAVSQGGLVVTIGEDFGVSQPAALSGGRTAIVPDSTIGVQELNSGMMVWPDGVGLQSIVDTINGIGATPEALMQILQALNEAGALNGELVVI
ncbi:flagellar basal body P-ring protein FlgI [Vibrio mediterranei]|uniref:flagellar basal body P-ring protein FlgI n=1 Tax=Vibrio mediterranei TaxID=689 RepID=UPI00406865E6